MRTILLFLLDIRGWNNALAVRRLIKHCQRTKCRACGFSIKNRAGKYECLFRSGCPTDWKALINSVDFKDYEEEA